MTRRIAVSDLPLRYQEQARQAGAKAKPRKFRNRPETVDGIRFDSAAEVRRYRELKAEERNGIIRELQVKPEFALYAAGTNFEPVRIGGFTPEFAYFRGDADRMTVEDVKSAATRKLADYRLRKRIFEANHGIELTEITRS